ncbi:hypothetical protein N007_21130 [Alicyclobacillus acidoterrestris ATCC 49025]|nr:hypothetical protein N007_21130 [Alicyclobacillus acidoterrestris ATCC 49025]
MPFYIDKAYARNADNVLFYIDNACVGNDGSIQT